MTYRNHTENISRKSAPHHRITVQDVIRDYQAGLLTPAGAIFYLVAASRKIGEAVRISRSWICQKLGIKKTTYYRAIAALEDENRMSFRIPDEAVATIPISTTEGVPNYIFFGGIVPYLGIRVPNMELGIARTLVPS